MSKSKDPPTVRVPPQLDDGATTAYTPDALRTLLGSESPAPTQDEPKTTLWPRGLSGIASSEAPTLLRPHAPTPPSAALAQPKRTPTTLRLWLVVGAAAALASSLAWLAFSHSARGSHTPPTAAVASSAETPPPRTAAPRASNASPISPPARPYVQPKAAAQALADGKPDQALRSYQALAAQHPEAPVYAVVARVLSRRAADCGTPGGPPCAP